MTPQTGGIMLDTPQSVSPGSITPAPMARTAILPASVMAVKPQSAILGASWTQIPGAASDAAAAPDGSLWVLSDAPAGPDKYIWHYVNGTWTNISGLATRLSVAPNGTLYAINSGGGAYSYSGGTWTGFGGGCKDLTAAKDGSLYVISNGAVDGAIWHYAAGSWTQQSGSGYRLAASWDTRTYANPGGTITPAGLYVINSAGNIYYLSTSGYIQIPGGASAITPVNGGFFVLGYPADPNGNTLYYYDLDTPGWSAKGGAGISISANGNTVYVIGALGGIYSSALIAPISIDANAATLATVQKGMFGANLTSNLDLATNQVMYAPMIQAFKNARLGLLRWPGGAFGDYYHWQTNSYSSCIASTVFANQISQTTFDEFMQKIVQPTGADVNITVNYGTNSNCSGGADPSEAAAWVDYANNQQHYGVKYWTIGNEIYLIGPGTAPWDPSQGPIPDLHNPRGPATYANLLTTQFYPLMKAKDPTIQIGVDLAVPYDTSNTYAASWDSTILANARYDFVEIHVYPDGALNNSDASLLTTGVSFVASAIAQVRKELAAAGRPDTPIFVGEWGLGVRGTPQYSEPFISIAGALYTAMSLGEFLKGGATQSAVWLGFDPTCSGFSSHTTYGWQDWATDSLFSAVPYGGNSICPGAVLPPSGTILPRGNAFVVATQAFQAGDQMIDAAVAPNLSAVKVYAARRSSGYGLMLVNTDQNNAVATTLSIQNDPRTFTGNVLTYGKAEYDASKNNVWSGPTASSMGSFTGSIPLTLQPWSITAVTLSASAPN